MDLLSLLQSKEDFLGGMVKYQSILTKMLTFYVVLQEYVTKNDGDLNTTFQMRAGETLVLFRFFYDRCPGYGKKVKSCLLEILGN